MFYYLQEAHMALWLLRRCQANCECDIVVLKSFLFAPVTILVWQRKASIFFFCSVHSLYAVIRDILVESPSRLLVVLPFWGADFLEFSPTIPDIFSSQLHRGFSIA